MSSKPNPSRETVSLRERERMRARWEEEIIWKHAKTERERLWKKRNVRDARREGIV